MLNYDVNNDSVSCNLLWILKCFGFDFDRMQQQRSLCDDFIFRTPSLKAHISPATAATVIMYKTNHSLELGYIIF